jgi:probable rRNA maturation factor
MRLVNRPTQPGISVRNLQRRIRVALTRLNRAAEESIAQVLKLPNRRSTALRRLDEVAVLLISNARMARIHQEFMGVAGPTDVITFDHGEIFISVEMARRNARRFGHSTLREIELYIVHGLLHLHGFSDRTAAAAARMHRVQERIWRGLAR